MSPVFPRFRVSGFLLPGYGVLVSGFRFPISGFGFWVLAVLLVGPDEGSWGDGFEKERKLGTLHRPHSRSLCSLALEFEGEARWGVQNHYYKNK